MEMNYFKKTGKMMVHVCLRDCRLFPVRFQRPNFRHK